MYAEGLHIIKINFVGRYVHRSICGCCKKRTVLDAVHILIRQVVTALNDNYYVLSTLDIRKRIYNVMR